MLPPEIRAVAFDAVGTVLHPEPGAHVVYAQVGSKYGSRLRSWEISQRFGEAFRSEEIYDGENGLQTSELRELERWRNIVARALPDVGDFESCFQELFTHFSHTNAWRHDEVAVVFMEQLISKGQIVALASNYDGRLRNVVAGMPQLWPIKSLIISSEVGWRKPAPQFFEATCQIIGVASDEILFIGDDLENDYRAAIRAGFKALLFDPDCKAPAEIARVTAFSDLLNG